MAEVVWAESALTNLIEIAEFIGRDSPTYAPAFVARIIDAVDRVALFPRLGRRVPEFGDDLLLLPQFLRSERAHPGIELRDGLPGLLQPLFQLLPGSALGLFQLQGS